MTHDVLHRLLNLMGYCQKDIIVQIITNIKLENSISYQLQMFSLINVKGWEGIKRLIALERYGNREWT